MAMKYTVKVEDEWRPDPKQTTIPGTEARRPQRTVDSVAKLKNLNAALGLVRETLVHQYDKGAVVFVFTTVDGVEMEVYRQKAEGIKQRPGEAVAKAAAVWDRTLKELKKKGVTVTKVSKKGVEMKVMPETDKGGSGE